MARHFTIRINDLREEVNRRLEHSTCSPDVRRGMASILEWVLMETGNYDGFAYLESAGMRREETNDPATSPVWAFDDDSRRFYCRKP